MAETSKDRDQGKPDLRDQPATSLRNTNVESALEGPEGEGGSAAGSQPAPSTVNPGASQGTGQVTRQ